MSTSPRGRWLPRLLRPTAPRPTARRAGLRVEPLEGRDVPAVINITVNPNGVTPLEGQALPANTVVGNFDVDNYIGQDQSAQLSAEVLWGDGVVSGGLAAPTVTFAQNLGAGRARYNVASSHVYTAASAPGNPYTLTLRVYDNTNQGAVQSQSAALTVTDRPLTAQANPAVAATAGSPLTNVVVARFTDANPYSTADQLTATINWASPAESVAGVIVRGSDGVYSVLGSHTYTAAGASPITVTVQSQTPGTTITITNTATVNQGAILPAVAQVTVNEGTVTIPAGTVVGTFTDQGGGQAAANYINGLTFAQFPGATAVSPLTVARNGTSNTYTLTTAGATTLATPARIGNFNYTVRVSDGAGNSGVATGLFSVINAPLTLVAVGTAPTPTEGTPVTVSPLLTFSDGNPSATPADYVATIDWGDGTPATAGVVTPSGANFQVSGTHTFARRTGAANPDRITVTVTDSGGARLTGTTGAFVVQDAALTAGTPVPVVGSAGRQLVAVPLATFTDTNPFGLASDVAVSVDWGDGTPADTTAAVTLIGRNGTGAQFGVTGSHVYANSTASPYTVRVTLTDVSGVQTVILTTATVTQSAIAVSVAPQSGTAGLVTTAPAPLAVFIDPNGSGTAAQYTATVNYGDGTAPVTFAAGQGIAFQAAGNRFTFTAPAGHTYARPGVYPVTVTVTGPDNRQGVGSSSAVVTPAALAAAGAAAITGTVEGAPLPATTTVATFTVADPAAVAGGFTATIDWGDGTPTTTGLVAATGTTATATTFRVTGGHTYTKYNPNPQSVTVTIRDAYGDAATAVTTVASVADAALSAGTGAAVVGAAGQELVAVPLGTFVDANPFGTAADHAVTVNWGDGTPVVAGVATLVGRTAAGNLFQVTGSHTYATSTASPYTVTVAVADAGGSAVGFTTTAAITQTPIAVSVVSEFAAVGTPLAFTAPLAVFTDENGSGTAAQYAATVDFGDGTAPVTFAAGQGIAFQAAGNRFTFTPPAGHTYARPGVYPITVTIAGPDSRLGIGAASVVVAPAAFTGGIVAGPAINTVEGAPVPPTTTVATFTVADPAAVAGGFTATIDWGDGTPMSVGQITPTGATGTSASFKVTGGHTYAEFGTYTVTVRVADAFGGGGAATLPATVTDAPLTNPRGVAATGTVRQPLTNTVLGVFTDTNPLGVARDYTAAINWNDPLAPGADPIGLVNVVGGNAGGVTFSVTGNHVYGRAGTYTVTIVVTDTGNQTVTITTTVTVLAPALTGTANPVVATEGNPTPANLPVANFNSPGAADPTIYTVTVAWGDGTTNTTASGVAVAATGGGNFTVSAPPHTYRTQGAYVLTVTITGTDGAGPLVLTSQVTVLDAPLTGTGRAVAASEGTPYVATAAAPLATFTDANPFSAPADFLATIDWGDGTSTIGTVAQPGGTGTAYAVLGSHTYGDNGTFTATVVVSDAGGQRAVIRSTVTVANVAPTAAITNTGPVNENSPVTVSLINAFDPSAPDTAAGFRYSFATTPGGLATTYQAAGSANSAQFTFPDGPATPIVYGRVFDRDAGASDYQTVVTVRNVAPTATLSASGAFLPGQPVTVAFTNQFDPSPVDTAAGFTYSFDTGGGTFGARTSAASVTFSPPRAGSFTVRGRIYDKDNGFTEYTLNNTDNGLTIKDPTIYAVGAGDGGAPLVRVFSPNGTIITSFFAYDPNYRGGVNVAVGDVTGDGIPDIVTGTGPGGGPNVKVFDGRDYTQVASFFATNPDFRGGVHVTVGDVDGDGRGDVVTGAGDGGGPQVQVFRGTDFAMIQNFFAYDPAFRGGVNVAAADVNGDGRADIITGAGVGGAPHVKVFDGASLAEVNSFYAYEAAATGGVSVAAGDIDGDGRVEIVTGPGTGGGARLRSFDALTGADELSVYAFGPDRVTGQPLRNGMSVSVTGLTSARGPVVVAGSGPGYSSLVSVRDGKTMDELSTIIPFGDGTVDPAFNGGVYIG